MASDPMQIERLKAEIGLKQAALAECQAELAKLQHEIDGFARQYERVVGPLEAELDAVRQQIEALQARDEPPFDPSSIWGGYGSIEESFEAKYGQSQNTSSTMITPQRHLVSESELRATYRQLARKYHPDTSTDPAEKVRLTVIMAQVNAAYRAKNLDELYALDGRRGPARRISPDAGSTIKPMHKDVYIELKELGYKLDDDLMMTKSEHQRLMTSPLMSLKIEYSLARSQGRDLLREIAGRVRADLDAARAELNTLRRAR